MYMLRVRSLKSLMSSFQLRTKFLKDQTKISECSICHGIGNGTTCSSCQAQEWRKRRGDMRIYGPFPESTEKKTREKETAHRLLDEEHTRKFITQAGICLKIKIRTRLAGADV
nr:uncharacterized protein LOC113736689 [Coffea arabica]